MFSFIPEGRNVTSFSLSKKISTIIQVWQKNKSKCIVIIIIILKYDFLYLF